MAWASSAVAPRSCSRLATLSPFLAATTCSFQGLPPVASLRGLRQQRHVFRNDAGFESGIGIRILAFGGIGELDAGEIRAGRDRLADCRSNRRPCARPPSPRIGLSEATCTCGSIGARSRVTKETSASGSAAGAWRHRRTPPGAGFRQQALRIERRDVGRQIGDGQRQVAGDAHERPHADDFAIADAGDGGDADHLAGDRRLAIDRQPVALA